MLGFRYVITISCVLMSTMMDGQQSLVPPLSPTPAPTSSTALDISPSPTPSERAIVVEEAPNSASASPTTEQAPQPAPIQPLPPHAPEQIKAEKAFNARIIAAGQKMRNIRSKMNRLSTKERYIVLDDLLRTAAGNRSVAHTKLNQLRMSQPNEWEFYSRKADEAIKELEASVDHAKSQLPPGL